MLMKSFVYRYHSSPHTCQRTAVQTSIFMSTNFGKIWQKTKVMLNHVKKCGIMGLQTFEEVFGKYLSRVSGPKQNKQFLSICFLCYLA